MRLEGQQFGRYRFERLIGRGAMGEVYLAVDPRIHQQVAVKVLQAETSTYPATNVAREAERFRREASAIANLRHPHIVPLYDYDETSIDEAAITYLVMPYYKEGSFTSWLRRRGSDLLPMEDVVYFVQQAADALQYAHNHQVIHRDVKPSNFLIETSENPNRPNLLLADFGISKFGMVSTASGTQSLGTLTYMPPEQLHGRPTYASDQYALAIMAYELLVGHPPFEGPPPVVIRQHLEDQPQPPSMHNPGLPRAVDNVLLRALEKKPENRYPTISEFARALQQALPGTSDIPNIQPESSSGELQRSGEDREITIAPLEEQAFLSDANDDATVINRGSKTDSNDAGELAPPSRATGSTETMNRRHGLTAILLVGLALLIAVGSSVGVFYFTKNNQQNPTPPTTTSNNQQNPYPPFGALTLNDALFDNSQGYRWDDYPTNDVGGACQFTEGGYHSSASNVKYLNWCNAKTTNFSNFAFEVQMRIIQGDCGGVIYRFDPKINGAFYLFTVCQNGRYTLWKGYSNELIDNSSSAIHTGRYQSNLIAVVANGSTLDLYVNNEKIDSVSDSTYSQGEIGVVAFNKSPTEVVFSNAKVWT
jgi:serine/threonine protein kinase